MMKLLFILTFVFLQNVGFGQLIITGGLPDDFSPRTYTFKIDTLRISGDSTFYEVSELEDSVLVHKEQQVSIKGENPEIIFHGITKQWYKDGSKKLGGQFEFGAKKGLWKYWDEKGNLTQDTGLIILGRGSEHGYIFIDGEKVRIKKE